MFNLVKVGGKGLGYVALQELDPGTLLISEAPVLVVMLLGGSLSPGAATDVTRQFCGKNREERNEIMSLVNKYDDDSEILGIFKTNAMVVSQYQSALFPKICRANHACVPNCHYFWNSDIGEQQLYVGRKVRKGEEVTVSYLPDNFLGGREERRNFLLAKNNFLCICETCTAEASIQRTMDEYNRTNIVRKVGEINRLAKGIKLDLVETKAKIKYKSLCLSLLTVLKKMTIHISILFIVKNCLFSIYILLCDEEMAVLWAKDIYRMSKLLTGFSCDTRDWAFTVKRVPKLLRNREQLQQNIQSWSLQI